MEGFLELIDGSVRYLGPLDRDSADAMLRRLEERYQRVLEPANRRNLLDATGKHPGLMRKSFSHMQDVATSTITMELLCDHLLQFHGVRQECETILDSLTLGEYQCLWDIAQGMYNGCGPEIERALKAKELMNLSYAGAPTVSLPLLRRYLQGQPRP
jgi:hypothetical protein